jgi:NAD(P)-dependent dehydrogenase (short-subunit alcohol dehydrogenase family)
VPGRPVKKRRRSAGGDRYQGSVAVVSGASSGLGRRIALDLAAGGAVVTAVGRRVDRVGEVDRDLKMRSEQSRAVVGDVADTDAWTGLLAEVEKTRGRIDVLVNNAAMDPGIRLSEMTMEDVRATFEVNFFAAVAGTLAVVPGMIDRGSGIVVNVSSDGGRLPSPGPGIYPASKAALSAFTESVSFRVARRGVAMHVVYPAWMPTDMGRGAIGRGLRAPPRLTRRTEEEVARLVLARMGGRTVDISAWRLIDAATVFRAAMPRTYHYFRRTW